ncbi:ABC transporter ATP-binding protein [Miltoncostaea marina]|uniref:ABC transporter ATP-binding protein n=1 Tax=Miltoncostaea marina TaxID=2843215 RepID=UPI001C3D0861|nr:ABC transporter ATP-binding protein [Miltoncostaea marina]
MTPGPAGAPVLVATGLARSFRGVAALRGVDLDLAAGESVALLGPNGAGKTTLLTILAGVTRPDAGTLRWARGAAPRVGWVPARPALYGRLTTRENLRLFAALEGAPDPDAVAGDLLRRADLEEVAGRPAATLSTGTVQRLNLAVALAGGPSVLLLDEPTATLSPDQRRRLWSWLDELRGGGLALLFSTQSVDEAVRHGDRMTVLAEGRLLFAGTAARLVAAHGGGEAGAEAAEAAFMRLVDPAWDGA